MLLVSRGWAQSALESGDRAFQDGEFREAARQYELAAEEVESIDLWYRLGQARARLDEWDAAVDALQKAVEAAPESAIVRRALGEAQLGARRFGDALVTLRRAYELEPWEDYRLWSARCLVGAEQWTRAEHEILVYLHAHPASRVALEMFAQVLLGEGRPLEAARVYADLWKRSPDRTRLLLELARARAVAEREELALETLELARRLGARDPSLDRWLGDLYLHARMGREASTAYSRVLAAGGSVSAEDYHRVGCAYLESDERVSAREAFERALQLEPAHRASLLQLARLDVSQRELDSARRRYRAAAESSPPDPTPWRELADLESDAGDHAGAVAALDRALRAGERTVAVHYSRVQALLRSDRCGEAIDALKEGLRDHPFDAQLRSLLLRLAACGGDGASGARDG